MAAFDEVVLRNAKLVIGGERCLLNEEKTGKALAWATTVRGDGDGFFSLEDSSDTSVTAEHLERNRFLNLKCVLGSILKPNATTAKELIDIVTAFDQNTLDGEQRQKTYDGLAHGSDSLLLFAAKFSQNEICVFLREKLGALEKLLKAIQGKLCLVKTDWTGSALAWATIKNERKRVNKIHEGRTVEELISVDIEYNDGRKELAVPVDYIERDRLTNLKYLLGSLWNPDATTFENASNNFMALRHRMDANQWQSFYCNLDGNGRLLWMAARHWQLEICRFLREELRADVSQGDSNGQTPFVNSCCREEAFDAGITDYFLQPLTITIKTDVDNAHVQCCGMYYREREKKQCYKHETHSIYLEFEDTMSKLGADYHVPSAFRQGYKVYEEVNGRENVLLRNTMTFPGLYYLQNSLGTAVGVTMEKEANINQPDNQGGSALFFAAQLHFHGKYKTLKVANDLLGRGADIRSIGWKDPYIACAYFKSWNLVLITRDYEGGRFTPHYPLLEGEFEVTAVAAPNKKVDWKSCNQFLSDSWEKVLSEEGVKQDYAQPPIHFFRLPHVRMASLETLEALVLSTMMTDNTDVFSENNVVVAAIVKYAWRRRRGLHFLNTFYHMTHLLMFTMCMSWFVPPPASVCSGYFSWFWDRMWGMIHHNVYWTFFLVCTFMWASSTLLFFLKLYFLLFNPNTTASDVTDMTRRLRGNHLRKFVTLSAFYFVLDFAAIVSVGCALGFRLCSSLYLWNSTIDRSWFAMGAIMMWSKVLYFLRPYDDSGHLMKTIMTISQSIFWFLVVFGIEFMAFSQGLMEISPSPNATFHGNWLHALEQTYATMMGDGKFEDTEAEESTSPWLFSTFICSHTFIATLILSNLLIGYVGYVYDKIEEKKRASVLLERATVLLDHEWSTQLIGDFLTRIYPVFPSWCTGARLINYVHKLMLLIQGVATVVVQFKYLLLGVALFLVVLLLFEPFRLTLLFLSLLALWALLLLVFLIVLAVALLLVVTLYNGVKVLEASDVNTDSFNGLWNCSLVKNWIDRLKGIVDAPQAESGIFKVDDDAAVAKVVDLIRWWKARSSDTSDFDQISNNKQTLVQWWSNPLLKPLVALAAGVCGAIVDAVNCDFKFPVPDHLFVIRRALDCDVSDDDDVDFIRTKEVGTESAKDYIEKLKLQGIRIDAEALDGLARDGDLRHTNFGGTDEFPVKKFFLHSAKEDLDYAVVELGAQANHLRERFDKGSSHVSVHRFQLNEKDCVSRSSWIAALAAADDPVDALDEQIEGELTGGGMGAAMEADKSSGLGDAASSEVDDFQPGLMVKTISQMSQSSSVTSGSLDRGTRPINVMQRWGMSRDDVKYFLKALKHRGVTLHANAGAPGHPAMQAARSVGPPPSEVPSARFTGFRPNVRGFSADSYAECAVMDEDMPQFTDRNIAIFESCIHEQLASEAAVHHLLYHTHLSLTELKSILEGLDDMGLGLHSVVHWNGKDRFFKDSLEIFKEQQHL